VCSASIYRVKQVMNIITYNTSPSHVIGLEIPHTSTRLSDGAWIYSDTVIRTAWSRNGRDLGVNVWAIEGTYSPEEAQSFDRGWNLTSVVAVHPYLLVLCYISLSNDVTNSNAMIHNVRIEWTKNSHKNILKKFCYTAAAINIYQTERCNIAEDDNL